MVHGLEKFKEYFEDHTNQYVFIGGIGQFGEMNITEAEHEQESDAPENDHKINATIWR